jgi:hypothetical protein
MDSGRFHETPYLLSEVQDRVVETPTHEEPMQQLDVSVGFMKERTSTGANNTYSRLK